MQAIFGRGGVSGALTLWVSFVADSQSTSGCASFSTRLNGLPAYMYRVARVPHCQNASSLIRLFSYQSKSLVAHARDLGNVFPHSEGIRRPSAEDLATYTKPPRNVKVLVRDFIHDALYNPNYGYFSHQVAILSSPSPYDFSSIRSSKKFDDLVADAYDISGNKAGLSPSRTGGLSKQLWHTPTELFQAWTFH